MLSLFKSVSVSSTPVSLLLKSITRRGHATYGSVLVFSSLYPQRTASAAGVRTGYILQQLCKDSTWNSVHYNTAAKEFNQDEVSELQNQGVIFHQVPPNRSEQIKALIEKIDNLSLVLFDRFYTEELYSFHVRNLCPDAVRVVDMQDMHSLRLGRQDLVQSRGGSYDLGSCIKDVMQYVPPLSDPRLMRELSSLHRSDLALVCSPHEFDLLGTVYDMPSSKLCLAPFWVSPSREPHPSFEERRDFCVLGGFRHAPNVDSVQQLAEYIWPQIRAKLPHARVHVYGAYTPRHIQQLHNPQNGFQVHGFAPSLKEVLSTKRAMLAPLRFGAGIKGKIIDSWKHGVPVVTTPIGSEGMLDSGISTKGWGGIVASSLDEFVCGATQLYSDESMWHSSQSYGNSFILQHYNTDRWATVAEALREAVMNRSERRRADVTGAMLWHQTARSTEYFSRWIECKERGK